MIFNRSHYEDVVAARVRGGLGPALCARRCAAINDFERMLSEEGTTLVKFFLHVSKQEQGERLRERLESPGKRWKFNPGDLEDRKLWPAYARAYAEALALTSTEWAPWYAVPADSKWYRNLAAAAIIVDVLEKMKPRRPRPKLDPGRFRIA